MKPEFKKPDWQTAKTARAAPAGTAFRAPSEGGRWRSRTALNSRWIAGPLGHAAEVAYESRLPGFRLVGYDVHKTPEHLPRMPEIEHVERTFRC